MREPIVIYGPTQEPITLAEAKAHCRIDGTEEDSLIEGFIGAAREYLEYRTGRTIHEKVLEWSMDEWPSCESPIVLPYATPLNAVLSVKYMTSAGAEMEWSDFDLDKKSMTGSIRPKKGSSYPSIELISVAGITIRYRCGLKLGEVANAVTKTAILMLVAGMYENRESESLAENRSNVPFKPSYGVEAFLGRLQVAYGV